LFIHGQGKLASVWKRIIDEAYASKPALVSKIPLLWIFFNRIPLTIPFNNFTSLTLCNFQFHAFLSLFPASLTAIFWAILLNF
ncbi:MAG TPA: hypothetical protein VLL47_06100, partial [Robiginitalea sp.]|nr:hypothetical protein [Robiginitalea sp.]